MINLYYTSARHEHHFNNALKYAKGNDKRLIAALYLLSADRNLWVQCRDFVRRDGIKIEYMHPRNLTSYSYAYFQAAKDILLNTKGISIDDFIDKCTMSNKTMNVIMSGMALVRPYPFKKCIPEKKGVGDKI